MSLRTALPAHMATAKANNTAAFVAVAESAAAQVKQLEEVVGPLTAPVDVVEAQKKLNRAIEAQTGESLLGRLLGKLLSGVSDLSEIAGPINDKAAYDEVIATARQEIQHLKAELAGEGVIDTPGRRAPRSHHAGTQPRGPRLHRDRGP